MSSKDTYPTVSQSSSGAQPEKSSQETIIYQTRKITDIAADMNLLQMSVLDKIIQKVQPLIKQVAVFSKKEIDQIDLLKVNNETGLIEIPMQLKDFGVSHQYYDRLRNTLISLVTLPIQMRGYQGSQMVWEGFTTLLGGVKFAVGTKRVEWNYDTKTFVPLSTPVTQNGYRQRTVILEFRKDILKAIIEGGPNGYIQLVKEVLCMMVSIYSNRIYKLICGFYSEHFVKNEREYSIYVITIEEFRTRMGLNNAMDYTPVYASDGTIIQYKYTPRTVRSKSGIFVEAPNLYPNIRDLKRRVLEVGKKELDEKSNLSFDYYLTNWEGKKVPDTKATHIQFRVRNKEKNEIPLESNKKLVLNTLTIVLPTGKMPAGIEGKITKENVMKLRTYVMEAYESICQTEDGDELNAIRKRIIRYLKSL